MERMGFEGDRERAGFERERKEEREREEEGEREKETERKRGRTGRKESRKLESNTQADSIEIKKNKKHGKVLSEAKRGRSRERILYRQPTGPNPPYLLDGFSRPALRYGRERETERGLASGTESGTGVRTGGACICEVGNTVGA